MTETDTNFKISLLNSIYAFIAYSPIEKWQGPLEKDEQSGQYQGFKYELLGSNKVIKSGSFIPLSQLIAHFIRYFHYVMVYLITREKENQIKAILIRCLSILISVTPYSKMNDGLLKCCIMPHITSMQSDLMLSDGNEYDESIQKSLIL